MEARELRIGNLVLADGKQVDVIQIDDERINYSCRIEKVTGIELTEEWLIKWGFVKDAFLYNYKPDCVIDFDLSWIGIHNERMEDDVTYDCPKYVHQLQNLYWCLTGTELTINN
jgi:hypothetical protein